MADDLYAVLGVPKSADQDSIKKAYRKLAKSLHPDKNPGNDAAETRFKTVNRAFDTLGDPKKRALYDEFGEEGLREGFDAERQRSYRQWQSNTGSGRSRGGSVEDMFADANGGGASFDFGDLFGRPRRRGPAPGEDVEGQVTIDFASSLRGTQLELSLRHAQKPVSVRIPAGVSDGARLRVPGQGQPSRTGGSPGDLFIVVHVTPHAHFRREGDDLHLDVPLTLKEAYLGDKVRIPLSGGAVQLKVQPRTQTGTVVRLRGKGVQVKGRAAGDLYVTFRVLVPTEENEDLQALIEKIAQYQPVDPREKLEL